MSKGKGKAAVEVVEVIPVVEPIIETGSGEFILSDNSKYIGEWIIKDNIKYRHGKGLLINGPEEYNGEWNYDMMNGIGEYKFSSNAIYQGSFKNNLFNGEGTYIFPDQAKYIGSWSNNKMHGYGKYIGIDEIIVEGEFFNGMYRSGNTCIAIRK